jgi:ferredoxin
MRIQVDRDLCQGHGVCKEEAPEVFDVADDTVVVLREEPDEEQRKLVKLAVKYCPTRALSLED